jgi:23S rRNA pseudouridine2604 synthase
MTKKSLYLAFNKPVGIECTTNLDVRYTVDSANSSNTAFPIGRLDSQAD